MARYTLAPKALEKIHAVMKELRIRPAHRDYTPAVAAKLRARFYMTPVVTSRGQTVWFKAILQDSPWLRHGLREEIHVQRHFADYERKYKPRFDSPSYIASHDDRRGFIWYMRRCWDGIFAGDMLERFGVTSLFLRHVSPQTMAGILSDVRRMTGFLRPRMKLDAHQLGWYLLDFHYYREHFLTPLLRHPMNPGWTKDDIDKMEEIFQEHRAFFRQHATVFSHGDFYPNNMMVRPGARKKVVLFDWELTHLNLPTFDPVMMYLQAWRSPKWQQAFKHATIRDLGRPAVTATAWRLATLSLATRLAGFCFIRITNRQPDRFPKLPPAGRRILLALYWKNIKEVAAAYQGKTV